MSVINNLTPRNKSTVFVDDREYIFDSIYIRVIFISLYSLVFCLCVFGNLLVILVVTLHWKMRSITKFCLGNLAFADFCVGIFCVYQNLSVYLIQSWVLGEFLCKMYQFINALSHTAAILILVVICVERYLAILHPFRCKRILTITRLRMIIVCVWIVSGLYCSPRLYYFVTLEVPVMTPEGQIPEIMCIAQRTRFDSKTFDMIHFFLLFLLPLLVISVLYTRVGIVLWRSCQGQGGNFTQKYQNQLPMTSIKSQTEAPAAAAAAAETKSYTRRFTQSVCSLKSGSSQRSQTSGGNMIRGEDALKSRQTVVKMLIVNVLTFALCNFPFHLRKIFQYWWPNYDYASTFSTLLTPLTQLIMYANCALNPIIYAFMSKEFRASFKDLLCCRRWRRPGYSGGSQGASMTAVISVRSSVLYSVSTNRTS